MSPLPFAFTPAFARTIAPFGRRFTACVNARLPILVKFFCTVCHGQFATIEAPRKWIDFVAVKNSRLDLYVPPFAKNTRRIGHPSV